MKSSTYIVPPSCSNARLDLALVQLCPSLSRSEAERLIENGYVLYEGHVVKKRERVREGASIQLSMPQELPTTLLPQEMEFSILYEDDALFVINKPPNLVVHPAHGNWERTFANGFLAHLRTTEGMDPIRPGIIHRLDKDTSGVLVAAKNAEGVKALSRQFHDRTVEKRYEAILVGELTHTERVDFPIGRDPHNRKKMACVATGKEAISIFTPLKVGKGLTYASIEIMTGRTHQIRVHATHIRHPVLGDDVYGRSFENKKWHVSRQLLHCAEMHLIHPVTSDRLCFKAPLPHDMISIIENI